jgi:large subunit ribosomal protein L29
MKAEDLKTKTPDELQKLLMDARKDQFNMRFQRTAGTLGNVSDIRKKRKDVARIKTFLSAKRDGAAATTPAKASAAKAPKAKTKKSAVKA